MIVKQLKKKKLQLYLHYTILLFIIYKYLKSLNNLINLCKPLNKLHIFTLIYNNLNKLKIQINLFLNSIINAYLSKLKLTQLKLNIFSKNSLNLYYKYYNNLWNDLTFNKLYCLIKILRKSLLNFNLKIKFYIYIYINKINTNFIFNKFIHEFIYIFKDLNLIKNNDNSKFLSFFINIIYYNINIWSLILNNNLLKYIRNLILNIDYNLYLINLLSEVNLKNIKNFSVKSLTIDKNNELHTSKINYILLMRYYDYIIKYNQSIHEKMLKFYKVNIPRDSFVKKLTIVDNSLKILKNSIYFKKFYPFLSFKFFKKYLDIILIWFSNNIAWSKFNLIYRNIFIMYVKHLNFAFFGKYLNWINKSKKFIITLNVNISKNNLFYTLVNKKGLTIATLSVGLFYALPRNKNLKKNPFKKSISYLTYEMFTLIFFNKFIFPLRFYKKERKFNFFKLLDNTQNIDSMIEWRSKNNKEHLFRKKHKAYFIFKFLRQKYYFPGLSKNIVSLVGKKKKDLRKLYQFVGIYKMYPRVHNGCRKKKKRRL